MKLTLVNKTSNNLSTDVGLLGPGEAKSLSLDPAKLYQAAAGLKVLEDAGYISVQVDNEDGRSNNGELMSAGQLATTGPITLYVETTGSDTNTGLSPTQPLKTIQAAIDTLPKRLLHPVNIYVGQGTFDGYAVSGFFLESKKDGQAGYIKVEGKMIQATLASGPSSGTASSGYIGSVVAPIAFGTLTLTGAGWTTNDLRGKILEITGGAGAGGFHVISDNTSDTISICGTFTAVDNTSVFAIRDWGTVINTLCTLPSTWSAAGTAFGSAMYIGNTMYSAGVALMGIRYIKFSPSSGYSVFTNNTAVRLDTCRLASTGSGQAIAGGFADFNAVRCSFFYPNVTAGVHFNISSGYTGSLSFSRNYFEGAIVGLGFTGSSLGLGGSISFNKFFGVKNTITIGPGRWQWNSNIHDGNNISGSIGILGYQANTAGEQGFKSIGGTTNSISNYTTGISLSSAGLIFANALTGTGNGTAISVSKGGSVATGSSNTITGTTELLIDGASYTVAALRALTPKVLRDANYGSMIYEF